MRVLGAPAVEQDPRRPVGHVVTVGIGDEHQLRRRPRPHAAEADREPAHEVEPLGEDLPRIEHVVAVGIFEDEDPIAGLLWGDLRRISVALGHPEPAAVIEAHRDRLPDVRLGCEEFDGEAGGHRHRRGRLNRLEPVGHGSGLPRRWVVSAGLDTAADTRDHGEQGDGSEAATDESDCNPENENHAHVTHGR